MNIAKSHIRIAGDDPSSDSVADLRRSKDEIQKAFQKLEDACTLVQETEPKLFQECQDTLDKGVKEMTDVIDKINTTLKKSTHSATPRVSDPPMALANPSTTEDTERHTMSRLHIGTHTEPTSQSTTRVKERIGS